jgi:hypothetical protein
LESRLTGRDPGANYTAWYESASRQYHETAADFDLSVDGLKVRRPDYLIVSGLYYDRFGGDNDTVEGHFFRALFSGQTPYAPVAEFKFQFAPWINPPVERANPTIRIFKAIPISQEAADVNKEGSDT